MPSWVPRVIEEPTKRLGVDCYTISYPVTTTTILYSLFGCTKTRLGLDQDTLQGPAKVSRLGNFLEFPQIRFGLTLGSDGTKGKIVFLSLFEAGLGFSIDW